MVDGLVEKKKDLGHLLRSVLMVAFVFSRLSMSFKSTQQEKKVGEFFKENLQDRHRGECLGWEMGFLADFLGVFADGTLIFFLC